jgi:sugar lactone lactonase YvrE
MKTLNSFFIISISISLFYIFTGCNSPVKTDVPKQDSVKIEPQKIPQAELMKKWETMKELLTPESVCYDSTRKVLYVSNVNGEPLKKDKNGFISKMDLDGKISKLKWIEGLDAPKGMGVFGKKLYVTNIDEIVEIDIDKNKITKRYPVKGAKFLNDISIDKEGKVYVSDMNTNKIILLAGGKTEEWSVSPELKSPNGVLVENDYLLVGNENYILKIGLSDKSVTKFIDNTGGIDGLVAVGDSSYIITDWTGTTHLVHPAKEKVKLLDTTRDTINAADIEYIQSMRLLLVPTFFDNRVMAYELKVK